MSGLISFFELERVGGLSMKLWQRYAVVMGSGLFLSLSTFAQTDARIAPDSGCAPVADQCSMNPKPQPKKVVKEVKRKAAPKAAHQPARQKVVKPKKQ